MVMLLFIEKNSSQGSNKNIIQNFKSSKLFKLTKYKKTTKFEINKFLRIKDYEKPKKIFGRLPSFFFPPFLLVSHNPLI